MFFTLTVAFPEPQFLYRITSVIRTWPCIRYKAIWRFEKSSCRDFIRPWPSISVIRPPFRYKAIYGLITERGWPYNGTVLKTSDMFKITLYI